MDTMDFNQIHFKLNEYLTPRKKFPSCGYVERRKWTSPALLRELCSQICDDMPERPSSRWTNMEVLIWLSSIGFPQYRNTFFKNKINGRTLLLLDASALCLMNVQDFDHIQAITKAIRDLYQMEMIQFKRSISLPPRYPETHFQYFRVCTGPEYENITRSQLWRRMKLIDEIPPFENHFRTLYLKLQHKPINQTHRIGYAPRRNMFLVKADLFPVSELSSSIHEHDQPCECIPPCECQWKEGCYRDPWKMACLFGPEAEALKEKLKNGDFLGIEDSVMVEPTGEVKDTLPAVIPQASKNRGDESCICIVPHICQWKKMSEKPYVLTVLRSCEALLKSVDLNDSYKV